VSEQLAPRSPAFSTLSAMEIRSALSLSESVDQGGRESHRFTSRHEVHRLQDLQRAYLPHRNSPVEVHRRLGAVASDASNEVRSSVDQGPQEII